MILFIHTAQRDHSYIALISQETIKVKNIPDRAKTSELLPKALESFLKQQKTTLKELEKIVVVRGPGSFVGTRTGVAFANAYSWALNVPVVGISAEDVPANLKDLSIVKAKKQVIAPIYATGPNITTPK
jgi:tRNA threonylcarbamoyl adenosine modification protein YeaZ